MTKYIKLLTQYIIMCFTHNKTLQYFVNIDKYIYEGIRKHVSPSIKTL